MSRPPAPRDGDSDAVTPSVSTDLQRLRDVSHLLDDSIRVPGTTYRVGIEPILGLLPVVGDVLGAAVAIAVIGVGVRLGAPRATLARIGVVYWLDATLGSIPVAGDLFDAYWKANLRAVNLLDARLVAPATAASDRRFLRRVGVAVVVLGLVAVAVAVALAWWLVGQL